MKKGCSGGNGGVRLSVIIPAYNCAAYLDECLDSVLRQLPADCELIVVDDGSTDGTVQLLTGYDGKHENLRILYRRHYGVSGARNAGLDTATGKYVAFLDCDDCLNEGFLAESLPLLARDADLYIFGIERIPLSGNPETWAVGDRDYSDVSEFADTYVRTRQLLIYSNCNKFYRRRLIEDLGLRFNEGVSFGEDRLFNYQFLPGCRRVSTFGITMLRYLQRSEESMSTRHIPCYFAQAVALHRAKVQCILPLSRGTTAEERRSFAARDLASELSRAVARFENHPEEVAENLPEINVLVFSLLPGLKAELRETGCSPEDWHRTEAGKALVTERLHAVLLPYAV